ncbi:MAG: hypothetical protein LBH69_03360 [Methanomassiliicoccaceae archaeon]|jgi:hypothetical protein|nr:hypothetical protein [Methanomassiliicoccaceae archaeon]
MNINKRGEGGFMESMIAVMIVVISLTAFLSFLAFSLSHDTEKATEVPTEFLSGVRIANGNIEADIEDRMIAAAELHGFIGMRVTLSAVDGIYDSKLTLDVGHQDSDVIHTKGGTIVVRTDDGRSVPVNYSVAVWS